MRPLVFFPIICLLLLRSQTVHSQLEVTITLDNQEVVGSDFYFDLVLRRSSSAAHGDLYLANADFILQFNDTHFDNPSLGRVGASPGWCNFEPTNTSGSNTYITRINYYESSLTSIQNGFLVINLNGQTPDEASFDTRIAKVDGSAYRLGRFKISGISTTEGSAGLHWASNGNLSTKIYTFDPVPPYTSREVTNLDLVDPPNAVLPVELVSFSGELWNDYQVKLSWTTATEIANHGFIVERVDDRQEWRLLGFVPGQGYSEVANTYQYIDSQPLKGSNLYRLRQIDLDGSEHLSPIVQINVNPVADEVIFYPNPVASVLHLNQPDETFFQIYNAHGQLQIEGQIMEGTITTSMLPQGTYFLIIDGKAHKLYKW